MELLSRIRGSLLAGAAGDALGYAVEFNRLEQIRELYGPRGIRHYELRDGLARISDDTQMTLFTCEGIVMGWNRAVAGGMAADMEVYVHDAYLNWLETQGYPGGGMWREHSLLMKEPGLFARRAPGGTCLSALLSGRMGTLQEPVNESRGCGGVMRVAPVGFVSAFGRRYDDCPDNAALWQAARIAAVTHGHPLGYLSAALLAEIIRMITLEDGRTLERIVTDAVERAEIVVVQGYTLLGRLIRQAVALSRQAIPDDEAIAMLGEGWVGEEAIAIAVYCALKHQDDLSACLRAAVNHSGDSDSTGAIAGNILGAWLGADALEDEWLDKLELRGVIETMAAQLNAVAQEQRQ